MNATLESALRGVADLSDGTQHELEIRLGCTVDGSYRHGLPLQDLDALVTKVTAAASLDPSIRVLPCAQYVDHRWKHQGQLLRTRCVYDTDNCDLHAETVKKTTLRAVAVRLSDRHSALVSVCEEDPTAAAVLSASTVDVCIHVRRSFVFEFSHQNATLRLDCSQRWSGETMEVAERSYHAVEAPVCSAELEVVQRGALTDETIANTVRAMLACLLPSAAPACDSE